MISNVINNWEKCGIKSLDNFSFKKHYSVMFDDEEEGFQHMFVMSLDELKDINYDDYLEEKFKLIDNKMKIVGDHMESFIKNQFLKDIPSDTTIGELMDDYMETLKIHYWDVIQLKLEVNQYLEEQYLC